MQHSFPHTPRKNRVGERGKASKREKGRREEDVFQGRKKMRPLTCGQSVVTPESTHLDLFLEEAKL